MRRFLRPLRPLSFGLLAGAAELLAHWLAGPGRYASDRALPAGVRLDGWDDFAAGLRMNEVNERAEAAMAGPLKAPLRLERTSFDQAVLAFGRAAGRVLDQLLAAYAEDSAQADWYAEGGQIIIRFGDRNRDRPLVTRVYDVRELMLASARQAKAYRDAAGLPPTTRPAREDDPPPGSEQDAAGQLIATLQEAAFGRDRDYAAGFTYWGRPAGGLPSARGAAAGRDRTRQAAGGRRGAGEGIATTGGRLRAGLLTLGLFLAAMAVAAWALPGRSARGAFVLTPGGTVLAAGGCVGETVFYAATYQIGPGQPWTAQTFAGELEEDFPLQNDLLLSWLPYYSMPLRGRWGYYAGADTAGYRSTTDPAALVGKMRSAAVLVVPAWAWLAAGAVLATPFTRRALRQTARRRAGRCLGCGYDLRLSPDRCPECGCPAVAG